MVVDDAALSKMKVKELQAELKKFKLDALGTKDHLSALPAENEEADGQENGHNNAEPEAADEASAYSDDNLREPQVSGKDPEENDAGTAPPPTHGVHANPPSSRETQQKTSAAVGSESKDDADASDSKDQATETLRIDNFRRPFTLNAVKSLVQQIGNFVENGFWMDTIKTHCYVTYDSKEVAIKTRDRINGKKWPPESGIALGVAFSEETAMEVTTNGESKRPSLKRKASTELEATAHTAAASHPRQTPTSIDAFFLKTETKPMLYYLPLTDEQVQERKEQREKRPAGDHGTTRREAANTPPSRKSRQKKSRSGPRSAYRQVQRYGPK